MIRKVVYHWPNEAGPVTAQCPCCGERLLISAKLLAPRPASDAPTPLRRNPECVTPSSDASLTQRTDDGGSGAPHDCCECHWWRRPYTCSATGVCSHPKLAGPTGMTTVPTGGGCTTHFLQRWSDGTDE